MNNLAQVGKQLRVIWGKLGLNQRISIVVAALAIPDVKERLTVLGADGVGDTPQHFSAFIKADIAKWSKVVKAAGIKVE